MHPDWPSNPGVILYTRGDHLQVISHSPGPTKPARNPMTGMHVPLCVDCTQGRPRAGEGGRPGGEDPRRHSDPHRGTEEADIRFVITHCTSSLLQATMRWSPDIPTRCIPRSQAMSLPLVMAASNSTCAPSPSRPETRYVPILASCRAPHPLPYTFLSPLGTGCEAVQAARCCLALCNACERLGQNVSVCRRW